MEKKGSWSTVTKVGGLGKKLERWTGAAPARASKATVRHYGQAESRH